MKAKSKGQNYKGLKERTKSFALNIIHFYSSLPKTNITHVIGNQLLRSGTSVGANYREGCRARSNTEFISKINIVLQELEETAYWIELLIESKTTKSKLLQQLNVEVNELIAIFVSIIKKVREK